MFPIYTHKTIVAWLRVFALECVLLTGKHRLSLRCISLWWQGASAAQCTIVYERCADPRYVLFDICGIPAEFYPDYAYQWETDWWWKIRPSPAFETAAGPFREQVFPTIQTSLWNLLEGQRFCMINGSGDQTAAYCPEFWILSCSKNADENILLAPLCGTFYDGLT